MSRWITEWNPSGREGAGKAGRQDPTTPAMLMQLATRFTLVALPLVGALAYFVLPADVIPDVAVNEPADMVNVPMVKAALPPAKALPASA